MTDLFEELEWRGLIAQSTDSDALRKLLGSESVTFYCGFDPTAPSLHIGNLVQLVTLRRLQQAGHRPIGLVGGATGLIGDPSGKSSERALNPADVVEQWVARIRGQVERFLDFSAGGAGAFLVSNLEWTHDLSAIAFLRDIGKYFSLNRMLARETVSARLSGEGMSYTEFSYMVLQALDYLELYRRYGCALQVGGSDQWGNITAGVDLVRRAEGASVHALTTPLLTKSDGSKFGKTESGTIWLDPELTSPYAFYQFWINVDDRDIGRFLRALSFRSPAEIEELERETAERPASRVAQRALAEELTTLLHGAGESERVVHASRALFGQGELERLDEGTLAASLAEVPLTEVAGGRSELPPVVDLLARSGLSPSKSAARRTIAEGGAYVNNRKVTHQDSVPDPRELLHGRFLVLRRGKRNVAGVEAVE